MTHKHRKPDPTPRKGNARTAFPETQSRPAGRRVEPKPKPKPKAEQSGSPSSKSRP